MRRRGATRRCARLGVDFDESVPDVDENDEGWFMSSQGMRVMQLSRPRPLKLNLGST